MRRWLYSLVIECRDLLLWGLVGWLLIMCTLNWCEAVPLWTVVPLAIVCDLLFVHIVLILLVLAGPSESAFWEREDEA